MKRCHVVSLGCPKNLVDTEVMLGQFASAGMVLTETPEEADLILVNTCGFIQPAVEEGIDTILRLAQIKADSGGRIRLVVTGCMVQRYGDELRRELPEVDLFVGTEGFQDIMGHVHALDDAGAVPPSVVSLVEPRFILDSRTPRLPSTPPHRVFVKVTEGCVNRCSYCMIPAIRGTLRSRLPGDVATEAHSLGERGVKEITLIAQDLTAYGSDLGPGGPRLPDLLERILAECSIPWIRLLYLYPTRLSDRLLDLMAAEPRILPYLEIPLQHVSDRILALMNRPYGHQEAQAIVDAIRAKLPQAAIRTTFMVGFPGETKKDFAQVEAFMRTNRLDHVGVFGYSKEEGSPAASLPRQCSDAVKEERRARLMEIQAGISAELNRNRIGQVVDVLVEGISAETDLLLEGRAGFQAPDIDGCVYVSDGTCAVGDIVPVRITDAHTYDLVGEILAPKDGPVD